ncbi:hypothetical protein [Legionella nagasakiensis]|uniref:hypothetical protein n=1 Tax=Legionella nagasakiensis TaxID=535290 RepID=UPI0010564467|nr:hypothetical protein [Legionella nagasakiensis]
MGKEIIERIYFPKKAGLTGADKPLAVILSSPYDRVGDPAVRFAIGCRTFDGFGYRILNKNQLYFNMDTETSDFARNFRPIFPKDQKKGITVWIDAHGSPGWLFAEEPSLSVESEAVKHFADFIKKLEAKLKTPVINIVLSTCHSATEYWDVETGRRIISPARQLSQLLPSTNVIGFIGANHGSVKTEVYKKNSDGSLKLSILPLQEGAVLFTNGCIINAPTPSTPLFFDAEAIHPAIAETCGVVREGVLPFSFIDETIHESLVSECVKSECEETSDGVDVGLGERHRFFSAPIPLVKKAPVSDVERAPVAFSPA